MTWIRLRDSGERKRLSHLIASYRTYRYCSRFIELFPIHCCDGDEISVRYIRTFVTISNRNRQLDSKTGYLFLRRFGLRDGVSVRASKLTSMKEPGNTRGYSGLFQFFVFMAIRDTWTFGFENHRILVQNPCLEVPQTWTWLKCDPSLLWCADKVVRRHWGVVLTVLHWWWDVNSSRS